jgi:hypothetical protein
VNLLSTAPGNRTLRSKSERTMRISKKTYPSAPDFWESEEDHRRFRNGFEH